jgi:2-polyprenyl-3-methyl-5-hydroxy-6-metoxy-1,4-benzoquinol methylase
MFDFHTNNDIYFQIQQKNCEDYIIPFIEAAYPINTGCRVLEIGCGTAGVLSAFLKRGCVGIGVDLNENSLKYAREKLKNHRESGQVSFLAKDIYQVNPENDFNGKFDIIVLKDVIEHIHNQERLMTKMKSFLKPGGVIFFGFPPWQMPFGGHQQICRSKFLSHCPYIHLLPMALYKIVLQAFKEGVEGLVEIKETGISIERFEKIVKKTGYRIRNDCHFFINPIYQYKFNWKVRKQSTIVRSIPFLRNFLTTSVFYLIKE